ncbi:MAG: DUF58 domain-containing protein [Pseudomonadota bacterium]
MAASTVYGSEAGRVPGHLVDASALAARLPDLLLESRLIANTVAHGLHGRRRPGPGETFWQFRRFQMGEPAKRIDWRRSARDDTLYVREKEWEAAHTVWLAIDFSQSMFFRSELGLEPKIDRAIVLALAATDLLVRAGERVGVCGVQTPTANRNAAERIAHALVRLLSSGRPQDIPAIPEPAGMTRFSEIVILSDLYDPVAEIESSAAALAGAGVSGHFVSIWDPIETEFTFLGRTEFRDPESRMKLILGRAESVREAYQERLLERNRRLQQLTDRIGWSLLKTNTGRPAVEALLTLHQRLSEGTA